MIRKLQNGNTVGRKKREAVILYYLLQKVNGNCYFDNFTKYLEKKILPAVEAGRGEVIRIVSFCGGSDTRDHALPAELLRSSQENREDDCPSAQRTKPEGCRALLP